MTAKIFNLPPSDLPLNFAFKIDVIDCLSLVSSVDRIAKNSIRKITSKMYWKSHDKIEGGKVT